MGLDMYMYRKDGVMKRLTDEDIYRSEEECAAFRDMPWDQRPKDYFYQDGAEQCAYWRKENAIHAWFVDHCQGGVDECQLTPLDMEQVKALFDLCEKLLANRNRAEAFAALPPRTGFFFGGTDVDEWYWRGLEGTVEQLRPLVENPPTPASPYSLAYQSSW